MNVLSFIFNTINLLINWYYIYIFIYLFFVTGTCLQAEHLCHFHFICVTFTLFVSLSLCFARGKTTVGCIIAETTKIIWEVLNKVYMPVPNWQQWKTIAERFESLWNLPNCISALDGKNVRIEKFANTGSTNFNYKSYHSVLLMACCDADGLVTMTETGLCWK